MSATSDLPKGGSVEEKELFGKFCKEKAVNHTHPLLNLIFGFLPFLLAITVYISIQLQLLPGPSRTNSCSLSHPFRCACNAEDHRQGCARLPCQRFDRASCGISEGTIRPVTLFTVKRERSTTV